MLDHVFTDAIGALRDALEAALLERHALEERFQTDVLLGDVTWETSYGLPGEGDPPRIQVDITLEWPTWSQTSYRMWYLDSSHFEAPQINIETTFRIQNLAQPPEPAVLKKSLPSKAPSIGGTTLASETTTYETVYNKNLELLSHAVEISYTGIYELHEEAMVDGSTLDTHFAEIGGWTSSALVRLGDIDLSFND